MSGSQLKVLKVNEYTYNREVVSKKNHRRWYCRMYHRGCKATVVVTTELKVVEHNGQHSHSPPNLYKTVKGEYVCIR